MYLLPTTYTTSYIVFNIQVRERLRAANERNSLLEEELVLANQEVVLYSHTCTCTVFTYIVINCNSCMFTA